MLHRTQLGHTRFVQKIRRLRDANVEHLCEDGDVMARLPPCAASGQRQSIKALIWFQHKSQPLQAPLGLGVGAVLGVQAHPHTLNLATWHKRRHALRLGYSQVAIGAAGLGAGLHRWQSMRDRG